MVFLYNNKKGYLLLQMGSKLLLAFEDGSEEWVSGEDCLLI